MTHSKAAVVVEFMLGLNLLVSVAVVASILFMILLMAWFGDFDDAYVLGCMLGCIIVALQLVAASKQSDLRTYRQKIALLAASAFSGVFFTLATFRWA